MYEEIKHNKEEKRFEYRESGYTAYIEYEMSGNTMSVTHTIVPAEIGGRGIAGMLTKYILDYASAEKYGVKPLCSYVATYIERHPEYKKLL